MVAARASSTTAAYDASPSKVSLLMAPSRKLVEKDTTINLVGCEVGADGDTEGDTDGDTLGLAVGEVLGLSLGEEDGLAVGTLLG